MHKLINIFIIAFLIWVQIGLILFTSRYKDNLIGINRSFF